MTHFRAVLSFATSHDSKNTSKVSKTRADRQGLTKRGAQGPPSVFSRQPVAQGCRLHRVPGLKPGQKSCNADGRKVLGGHCCGFPFSSENKQGPETRPGLSRGAGWPRARSPPPRGVTSSVDPITPAESRRLLCGQALPVMRAVVCQAGRWTPQSHPT